jgi:hypothetical protein
MKAALFASLAAIAVQPLFFTTWILLPPAISGDVDLNDLRQVMELLIFVVAFAAGFVLLLGLPLFFVLHRSGRDSWASLAGTGFVVAGLPVSILSGQLEQAPHLVAGGMVATSSSLLTACLQFMAGFNTSRASSFMACMD